MTERSAAVVAGLAPAARLEPDAISAAQDTVIGMANAAPAVSVGLTLAALAAAGLAAMLAARFGLRSAFFRIRRESDAPRH